MANTRAYVEPDYNGALRRRLGAPAQHWQGAYGIPAESYMPRQAAPPPQAMLGSTADATSRLKGRIRASGVGNNLTDEQLVQMGVLSPQFLQNSQRPVQRQPVAPAPSTQIGSMAPVRAGWRDNANLDMRTMDRGLTSPGMAPAYGPNGQIAAILPKVGTNYADLPQSRIEFGSGVDPRMSQARMQYLETARGQMMPGTTKTVNLGDTVGTGTRFTSYSYGPGGQVIENVRQGVPSQNVQLHSYTPEQRAQLEMNAMATREMQQQKREGIRANITQLAQAKAAARGQRMAARAMGPDPVAMAAMQGNPAALAIMQMQGQMGLANAQMGLDWNKFNADLQQRGQHFDQNLALGKAELQQRGDLAGDQLTSAERMATAGNQSRERIAALGQPDPRLTDANIGLIQAQTDALKSQTPGGIAPGAPLSYDQRQAAQQSAGDFHSMSEGDKVQYAERIAAGIVATATSREEAEQMLKESGLTLADLQGLPRQRRSILKSLIPSSYEKKPEDVMVPYELGKVDSLLSLIGQRQNPTYDARGNEIPRSPGTRPTVRATNDNPLFAYPPRR